MHGRLRVKTSAQQEAEKQAEREKKASKYKALTETLFKKRSEGVYDEETALQVSQILAVNPDFYTMWNYRREIFLHWKQDKGMSYLEPMLTSDLQFTEQCLRVNPKSYCSWHHRCWVMEQLASPDWNAEIQLCDRYLQLDGRNFHCWDYRRLAVVRSGRSPAEELKAADQLIRTNFSNYSSWHYRSHLLTQLYPPDTDGAPIQLEHYHSELDLVQNAAFTDPNDQAAWFYHRWLLQWRRPAAALLTATVCHRPEMVLVSFSQPVCPAEIGLQLLTGVKDEESGMKDGESGVKDEESGVKDEGPGVRNEEPGMKDESGLGCGESGMNVETGVRDDKTGVKDEAGVKDGPGVRNELGVKDVESRMEGESRVKDEKSGARDGKELTVDWISPTGQQYDSVWVARLPADCGRQLSVLMTSSDHTGRYRCPVLPPAGRLFSGDRRAATGDILNQELENIWQLADMEPDNKWVLLSGVVLMWALDPHSHQERILSTITSLMELDHQRAGYYRDLRSRFLMETAIESALQSGNTSLQLCDCHLSAVYHTNHLVTMTTVRLDDNQLRSLDLRHLLGAELVSARNNRIGVVKLTGLGRLRSLQLDGNDIRDVAALAEVPVEGLVELSLLENPVCDRPDFPNQIRELFPDLKVLNGEQL